MASEESFLGRGWSFPPGFTAGGADVETVAGVADIHESLRILVSTEPGERVMQENFGCGMNSVLFGEMDQRLLSTVQDLISEAILDFEPRIELDGVDISESDLEAGRLLIHIQYTVRATNSRYNMVFPFYLKEADLEAP